LTRILALGNSHAAAMRFGWEKIGACHPGTEIDIFAQHARDYAVAALSKGGVLSSDTAPILQFFHGGRTGRSDSVSVTGYDAYVLIGLGFGPINVFRTYRRFSFFGLNGKRRQVLSRENFVKAVRKPVMESGAMHLAMLLMPLSRPVIIVPTPLPNLKGLDDQEQEKMEPFRAAVAAGDDAALMEVYHSVVKELAAGGIRVIDQPAETRASVVATLPSYSENAPGPGYDDIRPSDDYMHMNADYGAVIWRHVLAELAVCW
jgi:hypothetical protein